MAAGVGMEGKGWEEGGRTMRTSTLAWIWPMVKAMEPPDIGHRVRFEERVFGPPQGKFGRVSSSKPRAAA